MGDAQRTLLSARVARTRISASAAAAQRARELRAAGVDIIELAQGEPDFNTPDHVIEAATRAMREGQTHYLNLSLILDATHGPTLVDTGLPGQKDLIASALAEAGVAVEDLKQIIRDGVWHKPWGHGLAQDVVPLTRVMSQIGG